MIHTLARETSVDPTGSAWDSAGKLLSRPNFYMVELSVNLPSRSEQGRQERFYGEPGSRFRRKGGVEMELPKCQKCDNGILIPLSDYGQDGASVMFKAWVCTNPDCGFSLRIDKGEVSFGRKVDVRR